MGSPSEPLGGIIGRVVERALFEAFYERQLRILETEDFVPLDAI